jgi:hypothetical protein
VAAPPTAWGCRLRCLGARDSGPEGGATVARQRVVWPRWVRPHRLLRGGTVLLWLPKGWSNGGSGGGAVHPGQHNRQVRAATSSSVAAFPSSTSSGSCIKLKREVSVCFLAHCDGLPDRCSLLPLSFLSPLSGPSIQIWRVLK